MSSKHHVRARSRIGEQLAATVAAVALTAACGANDGTPSSGEPTEGPTAGSGAQGAGGDLGFGASAPAGDELCDGYDNDDDGAVDEGCECTPGAVQDCYAGPPVTVGVGICQSGTQSCVGDDGHGEFGSAVWGDCVGGREPTSEICDNGIDEDCDGVDPPCDGGTGGAGAGGAGAGGAGAGGAGAGGTGGSGGGPVNVTIDLFFLGDCVFAACPPEARYPVGCSVFFTPGDDRGCVASTPTDPVVYFQAGDECDQGLVTGKLHCSSVPGAPLDASSCPINKPVPIYAQTPDGCPDIH